MSALSRNIFNQQKLTHVKREDLTSLYSTECNMHRYAKVDKQLENELWKLDNDLLATRAFSCLLAPQVGDVVLFIECALGNNLTQPNVYILSILTRLNVVSKEDRKNIVSLPNKDDIQLEANTIDLLAKQDLNLSSAGDIALNAPVGRCSILVKHLLHSVQQSLIQICKQMINRSQEYDMTTEQLHKTHARHQIITAEKDIRVNADRINMG